VHCCVCWGREGGRECIAVLHINQYVCMRGRRGFLGQHAGMLDEADRFLHWAPLMPSNLQIKAL